MTIHWCGTGRSAAPGLRRLIDGGQRPVVWNRTVAHAEAAVGDRAADIRPFTLSALGEALAEGDLVVSMLPAGHLLPLAEICLARGAHLVSPSAIEPGLRALDQACREAGLVSLHEVGLAPGIDHLMAHDLVMRYRAAPGYHPDNILGFTSFAGDMPETAGAFRYKFGWSPVEALQALCAPARSLRHFSELRVRHPWDAMISFDAPLPLPERVEVHPTGDSLPYIGEYRFEPYWKLRDFMRGTIRLAGWAEAWAPVLEELGGLQGEAGTARLAAMAHGLSLDHAYAPGEADRVLLFVSLKAEREGRPVFSETWALDATGDVRGRAVARLVSIPVSLAVGSVLAREIAAGVHSAPHDPRLVGRWLEDIRHQTHHLRRIDHLA
ncbi:MAG: saccharopine dehydrogenase [Tabrizicola sp.]|nr:saccharopine dehydrogenase [Tabrizicola sp.]